MRVLVTGSSGHLGEALVRSLKTTEHEVVGVDILPSDFTNKVGSIVDRDHVKRCVQGVDAILHTATLHKPHVVTHSRQSFVDTNITGTLNLLEEAVSAGVRVFVFTSTTSAFGGALTPPPEAPATWVTEDVTPIPKTTPFTPDDLFDLRANAPSVLKRRIPEYEPEYARRGWRMFPGIERVYVNARARKELGWRPRYDFVHVLNNLKAGTDPRSLLSRVVGSKGYHANKFRESPYPVA